MLAPLPYLELHCRCRAEESLELPRFSGSTFRGVLGHALRAVGCLKDERCGDGLCPYHYLFETEAPLDFGHNRGSREVPRPFALLPPRGGPEVRDFGLGVRLFGKGTAHLAYFIHAVEEIGRRGLGRRRGRFTLETIRSGTAVFYERGGIRSEPSVHDLERYVSEQSECLRGVTRLRVHFRSPTRIRYRGRLVRVPEFHILVRALLRRLDYLWLLHGERPLALDFKALIEGATDCWLDDAQIEWMDWSRHSSRQGRRIQQGGFVGCVTYAGDLDRFLPLLTAGSKTLVGKGTTFGMGNYTLSRTGR